MAYLVLDLDKTTFYGFLGPKTDDYDIDPYHDMHPVAELGTLVNGKVKANIELINAEELSQLIEIACSQHDGIIILTAGQWDASILNLLADNLDLSPRAEAILRKSYFHSALTDQALHGLPLDSIRDMPKDIRLQKIIETNPKLQGKHFVALDDDEDHINAYKNMHQNVTPVLATTHLPDKRFYGTAINSLKQAKQNECAFHPYNKLKNIKVKFFNPAKKRKREDDENTLPPAKLARIIEF